MIFIPDVTDRAENWVDFFTNSGILEYRHVYILNERNQGNSDKHHSFGMSERANDVLRFMWENKMSNVTLAGHGLGAHLATAVGGYEPTRVTGLVSLDSAP